MEFNIEHLLAAKRQESDERIRKIREDQLARQERMSKQVESGLESYEKKLREQAHYLSDLSKEYRPELLHRWFQLDNWTVEEGLILLCGYSPTHVPLNDKGEVDIPMYFSEDFMADHHLGHSNYARLIWGDDARKRRDLSRMRRLDNLQPYEVTTMQILGKDAITRIAIDFTFTHQEVVRLWKSGSHIETRYPPKYFIDWAISKRMMPDWIEWAKAQKYYDEPESDAQKTLGLECGKDISPKSEAAYLNIIGALLEVYWTAAHPGKDYSQSVVLKALEKYDGFSGMSERNLKDKLTKAMRAIKS